MSSRESSAPRWRTWVTRWGWLAIILLGGLTLLVTPSDEIMLGSRLLMAAGLLAAAVGVTVKKRAAAKR